MRVAKSGAGDPRSIFSPRRWQAGRAPPSAGHQPRRRTAPGRRNATASVSPRSSTRAASPPPSERTARRLRSDPIRSTRTRPTGHRERTDRFVHRSWFAPRKMAACRRPASFAQMSQPICGLMRSEQHETAVARQVEHDGRLAGLEQNRFCTSFVGWFLIKGESALKRDLAVDDPPAVGRPGRHDLWWWIERKPAENGSAEIEQPDVGVSTFRGSVECDATTIRGQREVHRNRRIRLADGRQLLAGPIEPLEPS